ncbi:MAG: hypothetical protein NVS9B10_01240 [Nevskia sp.]
MNADAGSRPRTRLEAALLRDRLLVAASLAAACLLCAAYLVPMALDMNAAMAGPARWMMSARWDIPYLLLMFAMWTAMMAGMMLPSAAPMILLYALVVRRTATPPAPAPRIAAFALGYLLAWTAFSLIATLLQWQLSRAALMSPMMLSSSPGLDALILVVAGVYQWTPLKRRCLVQCRAPALFLAQHWRPGADGALRMGLHHGLYCIGCCWALMLLLFFGGVMNLLWIGALTILVLLEKLAPQALPAGRLGGLLLAAAGLLVLLR